ncbi:hypothetical protein E7T09_12985 [Deinococcus sp. KSM4-11]|uniref:hypothetical protein n=1 Tax=Deinococcus sp. KSM4-11 TaxID=2568654 RepID=UPI0010A4ADEC|nr:hypothetical protein [Deinococcus sp. KSM4-11]THF86139.1 hypothetical protein E7T09_12985 [Deinococcus sp. KSM4-11]
MTGQRSRVARLEGQRKEDGGDVLGIFEADIDAGLWREVNGNRTLPLSPEDLQDAGSADAAGTGLLMLAPVGTSKVLADVSWEDL